MDPSIARTLDAFGILCDGDLAAINLYFCIFESHELFPSSCLIIQSILAVVCNTDHDSVVTKDINLKEFNRLCYNIFTTMIVWQSPSEKFQPACENLKKTILYHSNIFVYWVPSYICYTWSGNVHKRKRFLAVTIIVVHHKDLACHPKDLPLLEMLTRIHLIGGSMWMCLFIKDSSLAKCSTWKYIYLLIF